MADWLVHDIIIIGRSFAQLHNILYLFPSSGKGDALYTMDLFTNQITKYFITINNWFNFIFYQCIITRSMQYDYIIHIGGDNTISVIRPKYST